MKSQSVLRILMLSVLCLVWVSAEAGDVAPLEDGGTAWRAGVDGVVIEWGPTGDFSRIYSTYTQPVSVPNSRGVRTAKVIAEEKAKAAIIRYLEQVVSAETLTAEITADVEKAEASSAGDGPVAHSTRASSTMMSTLSEFTRSYAAGTLRGVIRLEEGFDAGTNEAWVKVGFSNKTMRAARGVRDAIQNDGRTGNDLDDEAGRNSAKSHVRKTEQEDW